MKFLKWIEVFFKKVRHKSWFSFIDSSAEKYKINLPNFSINEIPKIIADFYKKLVEDQLEIFSNIDIDSKLNTFAKCYKKFNLQKYLDFNLPKSLAKNLIKLRISAHTLLIEKGRYRRPKLPRDLKQCTVCTQIEDEEHVILFCKKYDSIRKNSIF